MPEYDPNQITVNTNDKKEQQGPRAPDFKAKIVLTADRLRELLALADASEDKTVTTYPGLWTREGSWGRFLSGNVELPYEASQPGASQSTPESAQEASSDDSGQGYF